jgi:hypothetical protein
MREPGKVTTMHKWAVAMHTAISISPNLPIRGDNFHQLVSSVLMFPSLFSKCDGMGSCSRTGGMVRE